MYFTDRGIEELERRRGDEEVTLAWLAEQLQAFVDAHPDFGAIIKARGGADVITGSNQKDVLIGGTGFDIGFGKSGKDRCKLIERRQSC